MQPRSPERLQKILTLLSNRQPDLTVFMDEVHKPHNLAAIVRTADAVGIGHVHAVFPEACATQDTTPQVAASAGSPPISMTISSLASLK